MSALLNNRYRLLQVLGSGGCGQTFLAEDTHMPSNRRCVVKQLKPTTYDPVAYQIIQERFQREAALLETLGKSNDQIPALYAYFTEAKEFYLVQDWIEGKNLREKVLEEGVLGENGVRCLFLSLLPVLDYVHSQGIIHRDIKPDNIMLREADGKAVLIDFGAVKEVVATVVDSHSTPISSIVIGSPGFMPLEQATGRPVFASDLYSLGLTAIYLLTGKLPQELSDRRSGEILWRKHAANVSPNLAMILDKATEPLSRDRYQTAGAMLAELQPTATVTAPSVLFEQPVKDILPSATTYIPLPMQPYDRAKAEGLEVSTPTSQQLPKPKPASTTDPHAPYRRSRIVIAMLVVCFGLSILVGLALFAAYKYSLKEVQGSSGRNPGSGLANSNSSSNTAPAVDQVERNSSKAPPVTFSTLESLRNTVIAHGVPLIEHETNSRTTRISNYPAAITVVKANTPLDRGYDISIGSSSDDQTALMNFAEEIYALGFTYQQGMTNSSIAITLENGSTFTFSGEGFIPDTSFFGLHSTLPIKSMEIHPAHKGGTFRLRDFYFFAKKRYPTAP
jgi:serine/threonine protein kinase